MAIPRIRRLVVIIQENISFDHYFATYPRSANPPANRFLRLMYPGFQQVNLRVPAGIAPGSAVPVWLTYLAGRTASLLIVIHAVCSGDSMVEPAKMKAASYISTVGLRALRSGLNCKG